MQPSLLSRSYLARFVCAALLQGLVVYLSLYLIPSGTGGDSLVWPPAAVGLGLLWFWGIDLWPALAAAFFGVLLLQGVDPPLVALTALGNAAESVAGAFVLRTYTTFDPMFSRLSDALGFIAAAFAASLVSATIVSIGTAFLSLGAAAPSPTLWLTVWVGHLVSILSIAPFVLRWGQKPLFSRTWLEISEGLAIFSTIVVLNVLFSWTTHISLGGVSLLYILIIPLIVAALRTGPRGMSLGLLLFALITATGIIFGPTAQSVDIAQTLFGVQMLIGTLSIIFLLLNSSTEERKEGVLALEAHVRQLEVAFHKISTDDQAKTDFIAILAHELRNPLSPLLSGLELLKLNNQGPADLLRMMGAHLHTIARLLDDLLDISRITQKKFKLQKQPTEIHAVIAHTLEMVGPQYEVRRHTLETNLPKEDIWLNADPVRLAQIFVNLLTNAAKYTDPGGLVQLSVSREQGELMARVKDNGIGITKERIGQIFEPFGGSSGASERRPSGLSIGLSLARRMASMHHGTIEAHSAGDGKGTEFVVRIPLPPTALLPLPGAPARMRGRFSRQELEDSKNQNDRLCILVVDDNEPAAQNLAKLLEHNGHRVLLAYDAPEALEMAEREHPQVALLDIGLPTMDGYQLARRMRAAAQGNIILIALTGYGQTDDRQKSKDAGFSEHLVKPVSIVDIERVLAELSVKV